MAQTKQASLFRSDGFLIYTKMHNCAQSAVFIKHSVIYCPFLFLFLVCLNIFIISVFL